MSYGLNLGGGTYRGLYGVWGGTYLRDILQISSRAHIETFRFITAIASGRY